jgi:hypothetical protein
MKRKWLIVSSLIVVEILLLVAIVAIGWVGIDDLKAEGFSLRILHADLFSAEADESWQFVADGPTNLVVDSSAGDITILGGDTDEISIAAHKTAWHSTKNRAEAALKEMIVTATQSGNTITVRYQRQPKIVIAGSIRSDTVDFIITVPVNTAVTANTSLGEVTLEKTVGDASLQSDFGDITIINVKGGVKASSNSGELTASQITAGKASIDLRSDFGNISIENANGNNFEAHSNSGKILFNGVSASGDLIITSDFGRVEFEDGKAANLTIEANSGSIQLTELMIGGIVDGHSDFGDITLEDVAAESYNLDTNSGNVLARGVTGDIMAHSDFGDIEVFADDEVNLELDTNSGSIDFSGALSDGPHTLQTDFGSIGLNIPENTSLTIDLETEFGEIHSDFPITASGTLEDDHWQGSINDGGSQLIAKTSSGDISLLISNP